MTTSTPGTRPVIVYNPLKVDDLDAHTRIAASIFQAHGWARPEWVATTAEDHGAGMARRAVDSGADLVCVMGGDGTVREVASAMAHTGVPMGVLALGTGNLLARNLGLPHNDFKASLTAVLEGSRRAVDLGRVRFDEGAEMCFTVIAGMGLDAEALAGTQSRSKERIGWLAYIVSGLRALTQRGFSAETTVDGRQPVTGRCQMVLACNCGLLPGGIDLVPEARIDDGRLDLMTFSPSGLVGWAAATLRAVTLHHRGHRIIRHASAYTGLVRTDRKVLTEVDGDPVSMATTMRVRVDTGALLVLA
ncbi:diacylglycerol/lipid kinase family protein [Acidipropionibacterium jensenii]|uniref:diacylglycerol/lipid kinase family protein n=1 Tax=Acidipropionibacterium jensenii TaxID=1749 RepID=UPI00214C8FAA|nr:diacylglycerol kinase family protein [Acidipropionibacterium jensenii]